MGPVAVGKSTLFIEKVTEEDIDTYRFNFVPFLIPNYHSSQEQSALYTADCTVTDKLKKFASIGQLK